MDLKEINDLINIRQYIANSAGNFNIDKKVINDLNNVLITIDKKIVASLVGQEFKEFISSDGIKKTKVTKTAPAEKKSTSLIKRVDSEESITFG